MRVTFDSNVWENLVSDDPARSPMLSEITNQIQNHHITPYVCEIALSLESVFRSERLSHASSYRPKVEVVSSEFNENSFTSSNVIRLGPDNNAHPGMHPKLHKKFLEACSHGFKVLTMTNMGTARAKEIPGNVKIAFGSIDVFWEYANKIEECSKYIKSLGCGSNTYHQLIEKYEIKISPYKMLGLMANKTEVKHFAQAIAEWADGDSLSAHYAYGNDLFCTNDNGRNAGSNSVFYPSNLQKVKDKFGIIVVTPEELINLTKSKRKQNS